MSKFGLLDDEEAPEPTLPDRLAGFAAVRPRVQVDLAATDAAAAAHGFVSREVEVRPQEMPPANRAGARRRRTIPTEPTRHLAIRLPASGYDRFVAFADSQQLTYHDALLELLTMVGA